jgi:phospholipase/carboxylesterase
MVVLVAALELALDGQQAVVATRIGQNQDMVSTGEGRLAARPQRPAREGDAARGLSPLGLGEGRDGLIDAPATHRPDRPAPLLVMLHGAGADARQVLAMAVPAADEFGVLLVAPDSRGRTWDVILGGYGPDVRFLDRALARIFAAAPSTRPASRSAASRTGPPTPSRSA